MFRALALMFGETAAVYAFLRFSRAFAALAKRTLSLLVVEFFDDFTQIEVQGLQQSSHETLEGLAALLGWQIAEGDKRLPFCCFTT